MRHTRYLGSGRSVDINREIPDKTGEKIRVAPRINNVHGGCCGQTWGYELQLMKGAPRGNQRGASVRGGHEIGAACNPSDFRERNSLVADANRGGNLLSLPRWRPSTSGGFSSRWQSTHFPARTRTRYMFVPSRYTSLNIEASVPLQLALARKVRALINDRRGWRQMANKKIDFRIEKKKIESRVV